MDVKLLSQFPGNAGVTAASGLPGPFPRVASVTIAGGPRRCITLIE
jgi:hypothetical protein